MVKITMIFGPYHHEISRTQARWKFGGILDDGNHAAWELAYIIKDREFQVHRLRSSQETKYAEARGATLPLYSGDGPHLKGTVTEILRRHIPKEQMAAAIARSIIGG